MYQVRSIGNGLHPVGPLTVANYALNPSMEVADSSVIISTRTNLVPNPSFGVDTNSWQATTNCVIAQTLGQSAVGVGCMKITSSAAGNMVVSTATASRWAVAGNASYAIQAQVRAAASSRSTLVQISWYDSGGVLISSSAGSSAADSTTGWTSISSTATSPSNAFSAGVTITVSATGAANEVHFLDAVLMEQSSTVNDYFDGDVDLTITRRNLCINSSFESGTTNWVAGGTVAPTITSSTDRKIFGTKSLKISWATAANMTSTVTYSQHATVIGSQYCYSAYVYVPSGNSPITLSAGGTTATVTNSIFGDWERLSIIFIATATSHPLVITEVQGTPDVAYIEAVLIEKTGALGDYFDSTTPTFEDGRTQSLAIDGTSQSLQHIPNAIIAWSGVAHASISTLKIPSVKHWTGTNANLARTADRQYGHLYCAKMTPNTTGVNPQMQQTFTIIDSTNYSISFRVQIPATITGGGIAAQFDCHDINGGLVQSNVIPLLVTSSATNGFIRLATTYLVPAGSATMTISIQFISSSSSTADTVYVDSFRLEQADSPSEIYVDGDFAGYVWSGVSGESTTLQTEFPDALNFFGTYIYQIPNDSASALPIRSNSSLQLAPWSPVPLTD